MQLEGELSIDLFTNVSQIYGCFYPQDLVTRHFINLYLTMVFQYLEFTLHTLVVAMSDKPRISFQVVRNNLCQNGMHKISEPVYYFIGEMQGLILTSFPVNWRSMENHWTISYRFVRSCIINFNLFARTEVQGGLAPTLLILMAEGAPGNPGRHVLKAEISLQGPRPQALIPATLNL